jgi:hypothetical protein
MVEQCGELRYTDPLDKLRGTQAYRHGPSPRERMAEQRRLDTPIPSWEDIDTRIGQWLEVERQKFEQTLAARLEEEREFWHGVTARALAKILDDVEQRPGRRGRPVRRASCRVSVCGRPDRLPMRIRSSLTTAHLFRHSEIPDRNPVAPTGYKSLARGAAFSNQ